MEDINKKIKERIKSAIDCFVTKDYEQAVQELKSAEVLDRDNPEILYNLGIAYSRMGLYNTAIENFLRVLSLSFTFIDSHTVRKLIAFCYINMEKYSNALKYLDVILGDTVSDLQALNMKGYCLDKEGHPKESLDSYREILKFDKNNTSSINSTAYILAKNNIKLEAALKMAKYTVEQNSENPSYIDTLGYVYMKLGINNEAEKMLKKAETILPFNEEIKQHLEELEKNKDE